MLVRGKVRGLGNRYADGVESQEIHVPRPLAAGLPYREGERVAVTLEVGGESYDAGLRSTARCEYVWISPDALLRGRKARLADILARAGFPKNAEVEILVDGNRLTVYRPLGPGSNARGGS